MSEPNPYSPPQQPADAVEPVANRRSRNSSLMVAWPVALGVNLIVPMLFGAEMLGKSGWSGVVIAITMFLLVGWWLCATWPRVAKRLVTGASIVALSQFVPLLQIVAGLVALGVAEAMGQASGADFDQNPFQIKTELGGWIVTVVTGCIMAAASMTIGTLIFLIPGIEKKSPPQPVAES
ncbi:hypothetical protein CKO51_15745 [Rhodopirellula sp. SM50]|nr:hypothetical protein [Rhodopirellula sp. SM50]PAY18545.1 hypothetical protein CKO51_15745 [Rhodopirellula sp. SM50]